MKTINYDIKNKVSNIKKFIEKSNVIVVTATSLTGEKC